MNYPLPSMWMSSRARSFASSTNPNESSSITDRSFTYLYVCCHFIILCRLDAKLAEMGNVDEDDFEVLRQKRKMELQKQAQQMADWRQLGHGVYSEVNDTKDFFNVCKKSARVVAHFYRGVTPRCQIVDAHFEKLAQSHLETRFIKVNVEKNPFLVERLQIVLMPTMTLIKDGKTEHSILGFDEFGGTDDFATEDVAYVLAQYGVLNFSEDRSEHIAGRMKGAGVNAIRMEHAARSGGYKLDDSDDDFEIYD